MRCRRLRLLAGISSHVDDDRRARYDPDRTQTDPVSDDSNKDDFFDCGRVLFGNRVAKREAEGTVHTKHQLKLDPNPEGT